MKKNRAWDLGLKKKREQELFFGVINDLYGKIYGEYLNCEEINKVLFALMLDNIEMAMVGKILEKIKIKE